MIETIRRELKGMGMDDVSFGYAKGEESDMRFLGVVYVSVDHPNHSWLGDKPMPQSSSSSSSSSHDILGLYM